MNPDPLAPVRSPLGMIILAEKPPIWDEAHKHFEIDDSATVYTYGDVLYNPAAVVIDQYLEAHEATHMRQQAKEGDPATWWKKYFTDAVFRIEMEAQAYGQQYRLFCQENKDRNTQMRYLWQLAVVLSSDMYRVNISHSNARLAIEYRSKRKI